MGETLETVAVGDLEIHYQRGPRPATADGPPVLFLHGLGSSHEDWRGLRDDVAAHRDVILPDARLHGATRERAGVARPRFSVAQLARDAAGLCAALGLERVDVVGLSMGGMTALQLAVDFPALVNRLVVVNAGPELRPHTAGEVMALAIRAVLTITVGPRRLAPIVVKRLFPKPEQQALREEVQARIERNPHGAYRRASLGLMGFSVRDRLTTIRCPTLIVTGDRDYTSVESKRIWAADIPEHRFVVVEDSGHATPGDQPEALRTAIEQFWAETAAS